MKRVLGPIVLALLSVLLTVACSQGTTPTPPAPTATSIPKPTPVALFPLSVTDSNGKTVVFTKPPERIVAIDTATVEILFLLGEGRRVVGTHDFVSYPPETKDIAKLGGAFALNFEKMVALQPDLVYIFFDRFLPDIQKLGVPVLYLKSPATLSEVADRIRLLGKVVGKPDQGEKLAQDFLGAIKSAQDKVAGVKEGPRLYHDASPDWWTSGTGSLTSEIFAILKAKNIFDDISGYKQVTPEQIVARDPQVIVSVHSDGPSRIKAEVALQGLTAVKEGKILFVDPDLLSVPGPRLVQGIQQVAQFLYPDLFPR
ncbi:MAG: ABC transporter substrate-binding protein [Chloroflexi bacterium]|nr:ABC transporter substrate-binding protein [Chloroflexota bacterium]